VKILNDIACNLNWIEIHWMESTFYWNKIWTQIQLKKERDVNWCKKYGKSICDYGDDQKIIYEKTPFHSSSFENELNRVQFKIVIQKEKDDLWNLKFLDLNEIF